MPRALFPAALAAAALLAAAPARAQPEGAGAGRWGSAELTVGRIDLGAPDPGHRTLVGLLFRGGMVVDTRFGFGLEMPIAQAYGGESGGTRLGNFTPAMFWIVYRGLGRLRMSGWLSGSLSIRLGSVLGGGEESGVGSLGAFARFWIPDPGLYDPDRHTARGGAHYRLSGQRLFARLDLRGDYAFGGERDAFRALLAARAGWRFTDHLSAHAALTNVFLPDPAAGGEDFLHAAEAGAALSSGARDRVELSAYLPLDRAYRDLGAFGVLIGYAASF